MTDASQPDPQARPLHVLLVDDDDDLRAALESGLRKEGIEATTARTAAEALAAFADPGVRIDVIVMDLMLPDSWGSHTAMERTAYRPRAPVVYISGYSREDAVLAASTVGMDVPFLEKPFTVGELAAAIREAARAAIADPP